MDWFSLMKLWITSPDYRRTATLLIGYHAYDIFYIDMKLCKLLIKISLNQNINIKDALISVVPDLRDVFANELVIWCPKLMSGHGSANFRICEYKCTERIHSAKSIRTARYARFECSIIVAVMVSLLYLMIYWYPYQILWTEILHALVYDVR